jgi:uncharacterized protein involved in outer membrane biogenesis
MQTPNGLMEAGAFTRNPTSEMPAPREARRPATNVHLTRYVVAALLLLGTIVFFVLFDWNWFKGPLERRVSAATGREFHIEGNLHVNLGWTPTISAEGLHLSNAAWSKHPEMASIERLEVSIALLPLFRRDIELPMLSLQRPLVALERNEAGEANWEFARADEDKLVEPSRWSWQVENMAISDGQLSFHEEALATDLRLQVRSADASAESGRAALLAEGEGRYRDSEFELKATVDSPLDLRERENPYHVDLQARAGATTARVTGAIRGPIQTEKFDVEFRLAGPSLADLYRVVGVVLPETPPYKLAGRLGRNGTEWHYRDFRGTIGDSDLGGNVGYDTGGARPMLRGELVSRRLDLDDLGGVLGATPGTGAGETASRKQQARARKSEKTGRVLPNDNYKLAKLRAMDADVKLRAEHIEAQPLPLDQMTVHLKLDNGVLTLDPLNFAAAGGTLESRVKLDAQQDSISTSIDVRARQLQLQKLFPAIKAPGVGLVGAHVELAGQGNSVARMLATADGQVGVVMGKGRVSNLVLELAGLDLAESLKYLVGKDRMVTVRCAYADVEARDGIMNIRSFAFDTTDTVLLGEGSIDLREEKLAVKLKPRPRDVSPVSLRSPLRVGGTFKNPSVLPEPAPLALRAAAAVALYALAPPAALLALIETGPGESANCAQAAKLPEGRSAEQQ